MRFIGLKFKLVILSLILGQGLLNAQVYKFQKYGVAEGICHPFVYNVNQDINGFLWASTGVGLCRYDGFNFNTAQTDSLTEAYAGVSFRDKKGNLWFGHSNGNVSFYDGKKFKVITFKDNSGSSINGFAQDKWGNILVLTQSNGIVRINSEGKHEFLTEPLKGRLTYAIAFTSRDELLVGTDDGIIVMAYTRNLSEVKEIGKVENIPLSKVQFIYKQDSNDVFYVGTEDAGLYKLVISKGVSGFVVENLGKLFGIEYENVQSAYKDSENNLWISTFGKGLFKVVVKADGSYKEVINYNSLNGLGQDFIKNVFQDREGNIWVSTYGNGLAALVDESFTFFDYQNYIGKNILSVAFHPEGYFLGGEKSLLKITNGLKKEVSVIGGLPVDNITALCYSDNGTLWVGTRKNGVYMLLPGRTTVSQFFRADNSLGNSVSSFALSGNDLYVGTKDGVFQVNYLNKEFKHHSTSTGLPHNNIHQVYTDAKGNVLIATKSNSVISVNKEIEYKIDGNVEIEFTCITEDYEGNIWAGTNGAGVFKFTKNNSRYFSVKTTGLKSDYCYAMTTDNSGNIWVGHRLGLTRINVKSELVKTYGPETGIDGDINPSAIVGNKSGNMLFGTTTSLIHYESSKVNAKKLPPIVNITKVEISDKEYDFTERIVLPYSIYKMRIDFIGLNYSNPEQVTYKYKLDNFDIDWSDPSSQRFAIYSRLSDGDYKFMVQACNSDGQWTEQPLVLQIRIKKPFWKTWWFMSLMVIALVSGVYTIIVIRERKQKEFQIYLEKMLDDRTKEVREQKEEIETKNRDITDSINYAQRIQASILPSVRKLQQHFTGSFVYYAPRDIVSGDFYWFDQLPGTSKFIIVCADSTGHGVPGAFMSMIGTTLIKDICNRPDVKSPADILNILDNEIKATLNQNLEGERPNDGMDIIVVELDVVTNMMRCSSAMRPFIVYQNGEQIYFKGSRNSIGGQVREEKIFETVELQLTKGDLIYMFSDGYPDQFGGPHGKKFKMVRLRNLLKDIYEKPMEEQYNYVKSNFELWRGELPQVDDVLFMGIRI